MTFSGFESELNGDWFLAKDDDMKPIENDGFPCYEHKENKGLYMWWMYHGDKTGHWVINETPGNHGNDRMMGNVEEFYCPQVKNFFLYYIYINIYLMKLTFVQFLI